MKDHLLFGLVLPTELQHLIDHVQKVLKDINIAIDYNRFPSKY